MTAPDTLFVQFQTALAGEYSLERELGRGGMGVVYLAREVRLAREVAIKVLPPEFAAQPERREQFIREAQMAARLSHPNIVPIHRVDEAGGFVYFVMAYIAGETLAQRIAERGPLPPHQAARVLRETAWALTYAHASGLVHRDVKADNILIERSTGRAVVTDFGIASAAHADARTSEGTITGSPHYASPEQIAGQPVDAASDLYSLGIVGYFALTGRLPFDAPTLREVVGMHLTVRPPTIASLAPTVPSRLAQIVERCLAKRPEQRPADARVFAESLDQAIDPPREFPAPIRVWLARTQAPSIAKPVLAVYATLLAGLPFVFVGSWGIVAIPVSLLTLGALAGSIPAFVRTHRLLAEGYGIEDIRAALRDYWQKRREESAYEWGRNRGGPSRISLALFGGALATFVGCGIATSITKQLWLAPVMGLAAIGAIASGALAFGARLQRKLGAGLGTSQLKFYNGKWGERFVKLAGLGIKKRAPAESLPQLTEVALGRATDALYDALPKNQKKQLKQLPDTVRRLEHDARDLRAEIDKLDASLVSLDSDATSGMPSALVASEHEAGVRHERDRLRADVRSTRDQAANRLAATVAALENIRLDLLRLQLGDGHVDSVTASLDAAREVASDLGAYVDATEQVERSLRPPPRLMPRTSFP